MKNQIAGNKAEGYYYVDTTGVRITDKAVKYAVQFVRKHTKTSDSNKTKLKKCYNYLWKHYKYSRVYEQACKADVSEQKGKLPQICGMFCLYCKGIRL